MDESITDTELDKDEVQFEATLRPNNFDDYIGQEKTKRNLEIFIEAARIRGDVLDHVLFYGPPGLGKTTLANIIASEMGANIKSTSGPVIEKSGDLAAILTNLKKGDILFIDEIHRLSNVIEEVLYSAMEDYCLDIMIGQGPSARSIKLELPSFTLVGATTRAGLLTSPLRDRFGVVHRLDYYSPEELETIVTRSASILKIEIRSNGAREIARRSRGTPRIANRLLRRVRDFAQVKASGIITTDVAEKSLEMMEVDHFGLDKMDHKLMLTLIEKFKGGPVGVESRRVYQRRKRYHRRRARTLSHAIWIYSAYSPRQSRNRNRLSTLWHHPTKTKPAGKVVLNYISLSEWC